jgi:hypothetical protein
MTPITIRPIPDGYTLCYNSSIWNVGFIFVWSEFYGSYIYDDRITIRPQQSLADAYMERIGQELQNNKEIFFIQS